MDKIFTEAPVEETSRNFKQYFSLKNLIYFLVLLIFINLLYLDVIIFQGGNIKTIEKIITAPAASQNAQNDQTFCSEACIDKINQLSLSLNKITPSPNPVPTKIEVQTVNNLTTPSTKEYYVPFGSGSGSSGGWQNVAGLQASINSAAYGTIKTVVFEASLHIPTGNETAGVRLYDVTQNHPVWNSEVDFNGNTNSVLLASQNISLDSGNNVYAVQMETQLQYTAVLDQSRIHITAQ